MLVEENDITDLITWSDSRVHQNHNSVTSNAVLDFLRENSNMSSVTMKYSLPGHLCIQQVGSAHSGYRKSNEENWFLFPYPTDKNCKTGESSKPITGQSLRCNLTFSKIFQTLWSFKLEDYAIYSGTCLKFTRIFRVVYYKTVHDKYEPEMLLTLRTSEIPVRKSKKSVVRPTSWLNVFQIKPKIQKYLVEI